MIPERRRSSSGHGVGPVGVQVNGKDRAIEPFGVVESLEQKFTLKHPVRGALRSESEELSGSGPVQSGSCPS